MRLIDANALKKNYYEEMKRLLRSTTDHISAEALSLLCGMQLLNEAPTVDPIEWFKAWIGEIMFNTDNEPITPHEIIERIDEGGLKRFIEDYEREKNDDTE